MQDNNYWVWKKKKANKQKLNVIHKEKNLKTRQRKTDNTERITLIRITTDFSFETMQALSKQNNSQVLKKKICKNLFPTCRWKRAFLRWIKQERICGPSDLHLRKSLKPTLQWAETWNQVRSWIYTKDWRASEMMNTGQTWRTYFLFENLSSESRYAGEEMGTVGPGGKQHWAQGQMHGSRESPACSQHSFPRSSLPVTPSPQVPLFSLYCLSPRPAHCTYLLAISPLTI